MDKLKDVQLQRIMNEDMQWDCYRSEVCHMLRFNGAADFIEKILLSNTVPHLWNRGAYPEALYLVALIDYLSDCYNAPLFEGFEYYRKQKLQKPIFPLGIVLEDKIRNTEENRKRAIEECSKDPCGKFFLKYNIIERSIDDVV